MNYRMDGKIGTVQGSLWRGPAIPTRRPGPTAVRFLDFFVAGLSDFKGLRAKGRLLAPPTAPLFLGRSNGSGGSSDRTKPNGAAQAIAWSARHPPASPRPGNFWKFLESFGKLRKAIEKLRKAIEKLRKRSVFRFHEIYWDSEGLRANGSPLRPRGARASRAFEGRGGAKRWNKAEWRPERTEAANREDRLGGRFSTVKERAPSGVTQRSAPFEFRSQFPPRRHCAPAPLVATFELYPEILNMSSIISVNQHERGMAAQAAGGAAAIRAHARTFRPIG